MNLWLQAALGWILCMGGILFAQFAMERFFDRWYGILISIHAAAITFIGALLLISSFVMIIK